MSEHIIMASKKVVDHWVYEAGGIDTLFTIR